MTYENTGGPLIPYLSHREIMQIAQAARSIGRRDQWLRNELLIKVLYDAALRVSEALSLRPADLEVTESGSYLEIRRGKGGRARKVAVSGTVANDIRFYADRERISARRPLFPIQRAAVHKIVTKAMTGAGIEKPDHVGAVHVLRHSGAIARLRATRNPKAVQDQLGHSSISMTMRYWKTITVEDSLRINQGVDLWA